MARNLLSHDLGHFEAESEGNRTLKPGSDPGSHVHLAAKCLRAVHVFLVIAATRGDCVYDALQNLVTAMQTMVEVKGQRQPVVGTAVTI